MPLTSAVQSGGATASNAYNYDPAGNRLAETTASGTVTGRFNNLNQLTAYGSGATAQSVGGHVAVPATVTVNAVPATVTNGTNFLANVELPGGTNVISVVATDASGNATTQRFQAVTAGTSPPSLSYNSNNGSGKECPVGCVIFTLIPQVELFLRRALCSQTLRDLNLKKL